MSTRGLDVQSFNPTDHPPAAPSYSHISSVAISATVKLVSIAGQIGISKDATSFTDQVRNALSNVDTCLTAAGSRKKDIVAVRQYVVNLSTRDTEDLRKRGEMYLQWWTSTESTAPPPSTLIGVESLAGPAQYEIELTCVTNI